MKGSVKPQKPFVTGDAPEGSVFTITRERTEPLQNLPGAQGRLCSQGDTSRRSQGEHSRSIISLLEPIRVPFLANEEWQQVEQLAYPDPNAKEVKKNEKVYHPPPPGKGKNAKSAPAPVDGADQ
ncbi:hypothetical protein L210DRAFT_3638655 [Boletus edulis BED1]|uniref:Uncharacterized protein n=1 Tax=Boletus edulis BED1 TaxID=1328754 RepID=A0AAD4C8C9_BOLED|nr:hypothetical protein L210DRAFT_3638655 [Boletus edulis BED1]